MCGIVGFINNNSKDIASKSILKKMVLSLNHRGPIHQEFGLMKRRVYF